MPLEHLVAGYVLLAVVAYGVLAGADFGGGVLDLVARGPRRAAQRAAIAQAMGPVWEANHVWLIFVIVLVFTGFPAAYAALSIALFLPFHLVLVGIALRGAAFVFRAYSPQVAARAEGSGAGAWGIVFGIASTITPVLLGMILGAVSSGHLRLAPAAGVAAWITPVTPALGAFALALCAYLAAVYLTNETEGELQEDFRRHALAIGTVVVALSVALLPLIAWDAPQLWAGLRRPHALPVVALGFAGTLAAGWALWRRRFRLARIATIAQAVCLLVGWGLAQHPWIVYPDLALAAAAGPPATLRFLAWVVPAGLLVLIPSLVLLFAVFKRR